jgi:hypothetical protein
VSSFSIYVILLNLSEIQVNINGYAMHPDCGARFNCGPDGAGTKELDLHILYVV